MARIDSTNTPRHNVLADANTGNRKVLYAEVEEVTALRATLDAQYRGARRPGLPELFARAFSSRGSSALELLPPPLPASFARHPEPRQIQLELKSLVRRHGSGVGTPLSTAAGGEETSEVRSLFTLLKRVSDNYEHLQNRVAVARRN